MNEKKLKSIVIAVACLFFLGANALFSIESEPQAVAVPVPDFAHLSIGGGYGVNYGGIGLGFEFNPRLPEKFGTGFYKYISFGLGFGYMPDGGMAYSFGIHLYPLGRNLFLQPRLSVSYGVVAIVDEYYAWDERRSEGVAFGAGFLVRLASQIFLDADVHYIIPVDFEMDELVGGQVRFSAGLRYRL